MKGFLGKTAAVLLSGSMVFAGMDPQPVYAEDEITVQDDTGNEVTENDAEGISQLQAESSGGPLFEDQNTNVLSKDGIGAEGGRDRKGSKQLITGYAEVGLVKSITYNEGAKPSLLSLQKQFPSAVKVYLAGEKKPVALKAEWKCVGEDYGTSQSRYYLFEPGFDTKKYAVRVTDTPYIEVRQNPGVAVEMIASAPPTVNEKKVFEYCTEKLGLNKAAACGILANMYCESGFRTNALGDGNTSVGLCQWHNGRWTRLRNYTEDWQKLEGQLDYMTYELNTGYSATLSYLKSVTDDAEGAYSAAYFWCVHYEMPDSACSRGITRGYLAKNIYWPRYGEETEEEDKDDPCNDSFAGEYIFDGEGSLNMRSGHSEDSEVIGSVPAGAKVEVTRADGEWAHVIYEGKTGLCSMEFLKPVQEETETD